MKPPDLNLSEPIVPLSIHLLFLLDLKIQCDQQIIVQVPNHVHRIYRFEAHNIILSRAPLLALLLYSERPEGEEGRSINLSWPIGHFSETAFSMALRYLYSDVVVTIDEVRTFTLTATNQQQITNWRSSQLIFTVVYWLTGLLLQAEAIGRQAEAIMSSIVDFDVIGVAVDIANQLRKLDDLAGQGSPAGHMYPTANSSNGPIAIEGPDEADSSSLRHRRLINHAAASLGNRLYELIFTFFATTTTFESFRLDSSIDQTLIRPLFPITPDVAAHYRSQMPVSSIQFGQFLPQQPTAAHPEPSPQSVGTSHTSHILLNLQFLDLKAAITIMRRVAKDRQVDERLVKDFVRIIIAERHTRRHLAKDDPTISSDERRLNPALWAGIENEELIIDGNGDGDGSNTTSAEWHLAEKSV